MRFKDMVEWTPENPQTYKSSGRVYSKRDGLLFSEDNKSFSRISCDGIVHINFVAIKPELTDFEKEYLRLAHKAGYRYIARDKDGDVFVYIREPVKIDYDTWECGGKSCVVSWFVSKRSLRFVKWENERPYNIKELLD